MQVKVYLYLRHYLYSIFFSSSFNSLLIFLWFHLYSSYLFLASGLLKNPTIKSAIPFAQCPKGMIYQKWQVPLSYLHFSGHKFHV